ncbi:GNAT family N-acetyltransferase [Lacticaseibacillus songhuajiangensis]|jgi:putative acetyltransferase|uniref:GNAT family N-acetyltransferase n=1 Tax=Lacticaseibacillus songhuajiangensis TaxID=1296539 RepID=UPI000F79A620|nr:GNAT family N-acetyltransferase [Lacticaseibacillus songhuajiangensis]
MVVKTVALTARSSALIAELVALWERSVRATHPFLDAAVVAQIKAYVPGALTAVPTLVLAYNAQEVVCGFMGVADTKLEMLFLDPAIRGQGIGRRLLSYGMTQYGIKSLVVNEQNPQAVGFYEHMGFHVEQRSALDEQDQAYPVLYMRRN